MDDGLLIQTGEWFEKGDHDLLAARILLENGGYTDTIAFHIQQAVEKYLKGYLVSLGIHPPRIHDLGFLLTRIDPPVNALSPYIDFCDRITRYYLENRYPPGIPNQYSSGELRNDLNTASDLIDEIKGQINHRHS